MYVKYCGPARDYSGYGEANRHDIAALVSAGVEITTQIPHYCLEISDYGRLGDIAGRVENRNIPYQVKIIHTTPNVWRSFMEPGKFHIGRLFWETDKIPTDFAEKAQLMDEIWTGSEFNAESIRKAGVTRPIKIIPEAIDTIVPELKPFTVANQTDFKFYSIFEWTERKNPTAMIEAYWREFEHTEGVSLTLKTYVDNFTPEKKQEIHTNIRTLRSTLGLSRYAPIYLYTNLMDRNQVYRFHETFDCFISCHRGEGWGIPQMEAMLLGKPIISTNCGGIHQYLKDKESAYLLPYQMIKLSTNTRNQQWYAQDQNWAQVSIEDVRNAMRNVFEHQEVAKQVGQTGQELVKKTFSLENVGNLMVRRLLELGL